jgi:glucose-1-phosphate thymidylyltransferase
MKAIILAAGFGTRLYPITENMPKALLKIKDIPLIEYILNKIPENVDNIYLITNEKFYLQFVWWLGKYENKIKDKIEIINDNVEKNEDRLGGLKDLQLVLKQKNIDEDILVILSDNYFDFSLDKFIENKEITLGVYEIPIKEASKFGVVNIKNNEIISFEEKPKNPKSNLISTGIYFFPKDKLYRIDEYIEKGENNEGVGYVFPYLLGKEKIIANKFSGIWKDIGSIEEYEKIK